MKKKKAKSTKKCIIKRKVKFENYKNCSETNQLENKINDLEKNEININSLRKNHKELKNNNKLILKAAQRFKSGRHIVFTEEINKINLS